MNPSGSALDPALTLAMSMHSQPGVYALLLGSGISRAAAVPTGWDIVTTLVDRVATLSGPDALSAAQDDPEKWWTETFDQPLGYSTLLEQLEPSSAGRQALLDNFLDRDEDEEEHVKRPTRAHRAIAQLVQRGTVKVIVTTNFDRLLEDALAEAGVVPTVVASPAAVAGMAPLVHAGTTVIKVHGDRKDLATLNTAAELEAYDPRWGGLLSQVFDQYGLLISGWSAEWDTALVEAIKSAPSRRYPLYWDSRSSRGAVARDLLVHRGGRKVDSADADSLFETLVDHLQALDQVAQPPITTEVAVARLKRYLPDPVHRIDLHDLLTATVDTLAEAIAAQPVHSYVGAPDDVDYFAANLDAYREASLPLLRMLAVGVWHDDGTHDDLWVQVLQRLVDAGTTPLQSGWTELDDARRYPALLATVVMGAASVERGREQLLLRLLTEPSGATMLGLGAALPVVHLLNYPNVLNLHLLNAHLKKQTGHEWSYLVSHLVREALMPVLEDLLRAPRYSRALDAVEYRWGLARTLSPIEGTPNPAPLVGEYLREESWVTSPAGGEPTFQAELDFTSRDLTPWGMFDDLQSDYLQSHREALVRLAQRHW